MVEGRLSVLLRRMTSLPRSPVRTLTTSSTGDHEDPAAAHAVGHRIAGAAVDHHRSAIHRIARRMLGISIHDHGRSAHEHAEVAAGNAVDADGGVSPQAVGDEPLSEDVFQDDLLCTPGHRLPYLPVERGVVQPSRIDDDPPAHTWRSRPHLFDVQHVPAEPVAVALQALDAVDARCAHHFGELQRPCSDQAGYLR